MPRRARALGERPAPRWYLATALATLGVALLTLPSAAVALDALSLLLPLAAGAAYAVYATASKDLLRTHDGDAVAAVAFGGGALLLLPVFFTRDLSWLAEPSGAAAALELGLVATALAYLLYTRGLARLPVSHAATLSLAEPLTATLLGLLVLGEGLVAPQLLGVAAVVAGLALLAAPPSS